MPLKKGPMTGSMGKIPGPYMDDVMVDHGLMEYPPFPTMDIGARNSGMPSGNEGPKTLEHVGGSQGAKGRRSTGSNT
jgi:hypothetical protein